MNPVTPLKIQFSSGVEGMFHRPSQKTPGFRPESFILKEDKLIYI